MTHGPADPKWPRLLSLSVHELRSPLTVVSGYVRMLLKDRAGALTDMQRRLLEETEKSCARLSAIVEEMSYLANLEAGTATFNRSRVDLPSLLADIVRALPPLPDREVTVSVETSGDPVVVQGDPVRLKTALTSIINALRRELVTSDELRVREHTAQQDGQGVVRLAFGDPSRIDELSTADQPALTTFDEWRGGSGLSLAIARRIIEAHDGRLWSPAVESKAGAIAMLPVC